VTDVDSEGDERDASPLAYFLAGFKGGCFVAGKNMEVTKVR